MYQKSVVKKQKNKNEKQISALITLLDDPDKEVFNHVFLELRSLGNEIIPVLETKWEVADAPVLQKRIEELIHDIQFDDLLRDFDQWLKMDRDNLINGIYLINKFLYPGIEFEFIKNKIDRIKQDIAIEINEYLTPIEKVKVLNHIIYSIHKFEGDPDNFTHPGSFFISNLIESKKGNSTSLGMLYLILVKELDIPIYGVNLPHHFILAYVDTDKQHLLLFDEEQEEKVLFYINPFNEGAIFTKKEIGIYLEKLNIQKDPNSEEFNEKYFTPIEYSEVIQVLISQLIVIYQSRGDKDKMDELEIILNKIKDHYLD